MSPAEHLLDRLEGVRENGNAQWIGGCPGDSDATPSLSVRELGERFEDEVR